VVGRQSGRVGLTVVGNSGGETLGKVARKASWPGAMVCAEERRGSDRLAEIGRGHATVRHGDREWARDDDGDGIREVHDNAPEGLWTGPQDFSRPFRGVSKRYLYQFVAMFEWGDNAKRATTEFLRARLGVESATRCPA